MNEEIKNQQEIVLEDDQLVCILSGEIKKIKSRAETQRIKEKIKIKATDSHGFSRIIKHLTKESVLIRGYIFLIFSK